MQTDPEMRMRKQILALLTAGELGEGGRLPSERALCERFGVGRRQVRRALEELEAEGLIWRKRGAGTFAGQASDPTGELAARIAGDTNVIQVMEARLCIEPELAALCAARIEPQEVAQLHAIAARMRPDVTDAENELWDSALHRLIAQAARNRPLLTAFAMLDEIRIDLDWLTIRARIRTADSVGRTRHQHSRIIAAIESGDAEAARAAMRAHLEAHSAALRAAGIALTGPAESASDTVPAL